MWRHWMENSIKHKDKFCANQHFCENFSSTVVPFAILQLLGSGKGNCVKSHVKREDHILCASLI